MGSHVRNVDMVNWVDEDDEGDQGSLLVDEEDDENSIDMQT